MDGTLLSISAAELYSHLGTASAPILVDVRRQDAYDADDRQIIGAVHHAPVGGSPVLALDMYEHSYHIDFGAKAASYVDTFMTAICWSNADRLSPK